MKLIERWRSDEMLRYLNMQANPAMRNLYPLMAKQGTYTLIPTYDML